MSTNSEQQTKGGIEMKLSEYCYEGKLTARLAINIEGKAVIFGRAWDGILDDTLKEYSNYKLNKLMLTGRCLLCFVEEA